MIRIFYYAVCINYALFFLQVATLHDLIFCIEALNTERPAFLTSSREYTIEYTTPFDGFEDE